MTKPSANLFWHEAEVTKTSRQEQKGHRSTVIWFTGLSGAGKSTIANAVEQRLAQEQKHTYLLDGDNIRLGLNKGLGFSEQDRKENIRRIGEVSKLFVDAGVIVATAFISPFREDRDSVRALLGKNEFIEVYVRCSIEECEQRDPKGLYKKARAGEIPEFTGISSPYEEPNQPELVLDSDKESVDVLVEKVIAYLKANQII
ncbi:adenylyl-sulfate kinase [Alkalicoccobacillus murimartini]|uniref:Adenylyl-sulfate kinase n=1 Tax=Alkalicoccobacillus murimartini TaxID=171685 RepID=A0ABT9YD43_9BACI|nr:adenylyl-sulfate kinase [Alkalicoccobacillus murimartini]MDQ0205646.1 adenylylsulfate kinase [Alkalicoccobacillus murimartini]